ncbi:hypothetical protein GCM10022232_93710 [Streptomyces plumbiresistens]|uniref:Uncharacterized protein n=1 Tax=Streptomyces plumbiresistens TaxID=511811 RepID=A0ABP7TYE3_9ACTN
MHSDAVLAYGLLTFLRSYMTTVVVFAAVHGWFQRSGGAAPYTRPGPEMAPRISWADFWVSSPSVMKARA